MNENSSEEIAKKDAGRGFRCGYMLFNEKPHLQLKWRRKTSKERWVDRTGTDWRCGTGPHVLLGLEFTIEVR